MRINPILKPIVAEKFAHSNDQLFGKGFLERAFKNLEADRALEKVADPGVSQRGTFNKMQVIFVVFYLKALLQTMVPGRFSAFLSHGSQQF